MNNSGTTNSSPKNDFPLAAWFLGPKAEHGEIWFNLLTYVIQDYIHWRRNYFPNDPVVISREQRREHEKWEDNLNNNLDTILSHLKAHFPFYSPRYVAHMLSEQTLPSVLGYIAGMLYNPNNVTDEAAPVTVKLEIETGKMVAEMLGYKPHKSWAHVCSGGTVANLEALWVARMVQFVPFILREYCKTYSVDFTIKTPNSTQAQLADLSNRELIALKPNESIFLIRKLAKYEVEKMGRDKKVVIDNINNYIKKSEYNPNIKGINSIFGRLASKPVIFVSAAAHYSIKKAANILGYGEESVHLVPVKSNFRIDVDALKSMVLRMNANEYIAAVIGIVGTTEEGAVDPIHEIALFRDDLAESNNRSFWLHIDSAWGGYIRSLFCGHEIDHQLSKDLEKRCNAYISAIDAHEVLSAQKNRVEDQIYWNNPEVYKAFLSMSDADSITVDPHKMGYVPYPAGIVAFKNGLVTELMTQRAQYISKVTEGIKAIDDLPEIEAVGPYILEGSKPGAAATACWLAHKTIPLTVHGHGKIVRTTLLNTKKIYRYIQQHRKLFNEYEIACNFKQNKHDHQKFVYPFTFIPLTDPDTNIFCFIAVPMIWKGNRLTSVDMPLQWINEINIRIHDELDIPQKERGVQMPYSKEYFLSNTKLEKSQYTAQSIESVLKSINVSQVDYNKHGLVVLRSTVMNPFYYMAEKRGMDYLHGFVKHLHKTTRSIISQVYNEMSKFKE